MPDPDQSSPRRRGRPRTFDADKALSVAMDRFWTDGYAATSMEEIARSAGVAKPALYQAFGGKDGLMAAALERYIRTRAGPSLAALDAHDRIEAAVRAHLMAIIDGFAGDDTPTGCLMTSCAIEMGGRADGLGGLVARLHQQAVEALRRRLAQAVQAGQLHPDTDVEALALFYRGQAYALGVLSRSGAGRAELEAVAEQAVAALPLA